MFYIIFFLILQSNGETIHVQKFGTTLYEQFRPLNSKLHTPPTTTEKIFMNTLSCVEC